MTKIRADGPRRPGEVHDAQGALGALDAVDGVAARLELVCACSKIGAGENDLGCALTTRFGGHGPGATYQELLAHEKRAQVASPTVLHGPEWQWKNLAPVSIRLDEDHRLPIQMKIFADQAMRRGRAVYYGNISGNYALGVEAGLAILERAGGRVAVERIGRAGFLGTGSDAAAERLAEANYCCEDDDEDEKRSFLYVWTEMCLKIDFHEGRIGITAVGTDRAWLVDLLKSFTKDVVYQNPDSVSVLCEGDGSLFSRELPGKVGQELVRGNYVAEVLEAFDHVAGDLVAADPCGRLVLVDGPTGTGKTHFVYGLVHALPRAKFLVCPATMVDALVGPKLLPVLSGIAKGKVPLILVIEDADSALVPRGADNIDAISALLNLTDGIIGAGLSLRVLCTTNAKQRDIDKALTRPGRLCRKVSIGPLPARHAQDVLHRLVGAKIDDAAWARAEEKIVGFKSAWEGGLGGAGVTLAEIYLQAKQVKGQMR